MIQRLYVHNFRCLENFELPIADKQTALLIGKNGAGKSTIADALTLFQSIARGSNRVSAILQSSDFTRGRVDVPIRFELEVAIAGKLFSYALAFELPDGFKELRVVEEQFAVEGNAVFSRKGAQVTLLRSGKESEAQFLVDWHLVALPLIQERSGTDPLAVFKRWLSRMLIISPIPALIKGDSDGETLTPHRHMTDFAAWWTGLLAQYPAAYTDIDGYLKAVMPDFSDVKNPVIGKEARSLMVQFKEKKAELSLPFESLSDGEKCYFICATVLAANEYYGPLFCFWDEPDTHLSLSEVGHFVLALRRSFHHQGQLLVTSHNPEAIRTFVRDNTLIIGRASHVEPPRIRLVSDLNIVGDITDALIRDDVTQ